MSMEFLVRGITEFGEPGVFVAFEESVDELVATSRRGLRPQAAPR
jgi:circadian clock protein KaiC